MSVFITGTGTGVGKTVVTALLAGKALSEGLRVCVYKPVQTGSPEPAEDPAQVQAWCGPDVAVYCSYCFPEPATPSVADRAGVINPRRILADFIDLKRQYDVVLVEGAGGVRVPVTSKVEVIDLIRMLQLPAVVVASPYLGTINQTLLTVEALQHRQIEMAGVIVSGMPEETTDPAVSSLPEVLEAVLPVPLLGMLPELALPAGVFSPESPALKAVLHYLKM